MKKVKILTIIFAIVAITMIAFWGIYVPKQNRMSNIVKEYSFTMDLEGTRNIRLKVDTTNQTVIKDAEGKEVEQTEELTDEQIAEKGYTKEETTKNKEEDLTKENYQATKKLLEKRLKKLGVDNYTIKLDEQTGDMVVELTENDKTDSIISNMGTTGKFEIVDSQTNKVLMDNSDIKLANVMYGSGNSTTSSGTTVYLNIEFTKEGTKKLEEISSKYQKVEKTEETENTEDTENTENTEDTASTEENKISMKIDDEEIMSTSFEEPIKTGKLQLSIGSSTTDTKTLQSYVEQANNMAVVLDTGKMPIQYQVDENKYILSDITSNEIDIVIYGITVVVAIAIIILIIRYKQIGVLGTISYIGFISTFLLLIRYANVELSTEGIFGIVIALILNYVFINQLLVKLKKEKIDKTTINTKIKETYREFFVKMIPICIAIITFCFINWMPISSLGNVMFWGIVLIALYNFIVTNVLLKIKASK